MKKLIAVSILAVALVGSQAFARPAETGPKNTILPPAPVAAPTIKTTPDKTIFIRNSGLSSRVTVITAGATISWVNLDRRTQTVARESNDNENMGGDHSGQYGYHVGGDGLNSFVFEMQKGDMSSLSFNTPGVYEYTLDSNPGLSAMIIVKEGVDQGEVKTIRK